MSNEEMIDNMQNYRRSWGKKAFFIIPMVALAVFGISAIVMLLWNCIIPGLFPTVGTLTYWHAVGLLILCKILFGGFRKGGGWRGRHRMNAAWKEKWSQMSEEDKAKFKEEWKSRCRNSC